MRKVDPQLAAIRQAAKERFLAQKAAAPAADAAPSLPAVLAHLPPEKLDAPIGSLLADAPPEFTRPVKRPRTDPDVFVIPKAVKECSALGPRWNIDGLDEVGGGPALSKRTLAVAKEVAEKRPMAVFLQEVVPPALELLAAPQTLGTEYEILVPKDPPLPYYVAILLDRKRLVKLGEPVTVPFPSTQMGRQLLTIVVELKEKPKAGPLLLATAHLESTKDHAVERKRQLTQSLRYLQKAVGKPPAGVPGAPPVAAALFGGDLNIRDEEVKAVHKEMGEDARGLADVWCFCGSPEADRWTWDTTANTNIGATFSCKTRFDRMLFISPGISDAKGCPSLAAPKAKAAAKPQEHPSDRWRPTRIELVGKSKVPDLGRFPSDHWGVLTFWEDCPAKPLFASGERKATLPIAASKGGAVIDLDS
ncbi:Tyrosyl-DNA phosphodiesterase 2 [Symbiodinium microadriaticum]|uniref:Tyrosyl-DNA phosphodiesterase 2 n=1 Tax=Symbiodinium microadriaticum TaxID=2951 RepID=A0A1Q9F7L1_SYMMI|nr:Tyrosyl-DNA phosphodiesterase 2 [Symbiodinium microadriaticum]